MIDYLNPNIEGRLRDVSAQALAYVGDAVFELMVRTYYCIDNAATSGKLHNKTVKLVSAKSQAALCDALLPLLSEDEIDIYKRGRNAHTGSVPKNSTTSQYHAATGVEALFGYLYLCGNAKRLNELFETVVKEKG